MVARRKSVLVGPDRAAFDEREHVRKGRDQDDRLDRRPDDDVLALELVRLLGDDLRPVAELGRSSIDLLSPAVEPAHIGKNLAALGIEDLPEFEVPVVGTDLDQPLVILGGGEPCLSAVGEVQAHPVTAVQTRDPEDHHIADHGHGVIAVNQLLVHFMHLLLLIIYFTMFESYSKIKAEEKSGFQYFWLDLKTPLILPLGLLCYDEADA